MSSALPPNFVDLITACSRVNSEVNVMGVVTDFMAPKPSRGTDCMCTFSITDPTYNRYNNVGLKIRFFRPIENELPAIQGNGDIVLLRFLKIKEWSGMTIGLSNRGTSWAVFPNASIPAQIKASQQQVKHFKEPRSPVPSPPEMRYAISLHESSDPITFTEPTPAPSQPFTSSVPTGSATAGRVWRDKFALIKSIVCDTYYDLVGQVVKIYPHNDRVELYLTDYTSNTLLWNYEWGEDDADGFGREGDAYNYVPRASTNKKWPGPFGRMTLTVTLWPPHAYFGRHNVKENDFVHLRNVHIKFSKDSKLEGVLHSDQRNPDRVDVTIWKNNEGDDRVKDLLRRKRDYTKKFQTSSEAFVAEARGLKRKSIEEANAKPLSRTAQRKKRKQEREQLAKAEHQDANKGPDKENTGRIGTNEQSSDSQCRTKSQKHNMNRNVNCSNHLITPRSLSSILSLDKHANITPGGTSYTLPFQNINSRAVVRVIDFSPSNLMDFAVPCPKPSEYDILSDPGDNSDESGSETQSSSDTGSVTDNARRWEWRFVLRLEDAMGHKNEGKAAMEVYVAGQDAECLLKLDAEDLRKSPKALAALREKLFLLWGDLEEQKTRQSTILKQVDGNSRSPRKEEILQGKPFQCCLKEYGVKRRLQRSTKGEDKESGDECSNENKDWIWERKWRMFGVTII